MLESLQDKHFSQLIQKKMFVLVYLKNGIKLSGRIVGHTSEVIFLQDSIVQVVYKSGISTVVFE